MSYQPTNWKDRVVEKPRTFDVTNNPDGSITLEPKPGTVLQEGTPVNAANMNKLEQGLVSHQADYALHEWLDNVATTLHNGASGSLERVDERVGGVLRRRTTLGYVGGSLSTVNVKVYASNGSTIEREWTDTLAMPNIIREVIK